MKTDKRSPKCRTGSREGWKNKLRMLQTPHLLSPPPLGELSVCHNHQSSQIPQPLGDKNKTEKNMSKSHMPRLWCKEVWWGKISWNSIHFSTFGRTFQSAKPSAWRTTNTFTFWAEVFTVLIYQILSFLWTNDWCMFCWTPQICKFPKSVLQVVTTNSQNCLERWNPILFLI